MAVTLPAQGTGTSTPVIATDQITSEEYQLIKWGIGAAGAFTLVSGGAGAVGAGVQRVTLASDDPAVVDLAALETLITTIDGVLDAIAASAAIMDDWDETNRAAVNLISGQAGIAGGTGVDGATVPRVTLATDVGLPAGTNALGTILPPDIDVTAHSNYARKYYTSATPTDGIIWSPAAGKRWHVQWIYINVSAASTVTLEDDKAGGDDPVLKGEFAANSGVYLVFPPHYPMASGEDAADLTITASAGTVYVSCGGYEV